MVGASLSRNDELWNAASPFGAIPGDDVEPLAIEVHGLTRRYGSLVALADVSFAVRRGEIFGVLGPNGAGKTTLLDTLEGLALPQGGSVHVLGLDIARSPQQVKQRIGVQLQASNYPAYLSLMEILQLFGSFYERCSDPETLLSRVGLVGRAHSRVGQLSGGLAQRFSIVAALVNNPELVFLDEPTAGLDPDARRSLWDLVREVRAAGTTVVLSTHYMEEAEQLCDRVAIIDGGCIVAVDTPRALVRRLDAPYRVRLLTRDPLPQARLTSLPDVFGVEQERTDEGVLVRLHTANAEAAAAAASLTAEVGAGLLDLLVEPATLEDLFLVLTGRHLGADQHGVSTVNVRSTTAAGVSEGEEG